MADAVRHIQDAYYFEVPKLIWQRNYQSFDEVPGFVREFHEADIEHGHLTLAQVNHELSGKVLIPQPFGTLKNLYEPASGFCISKFMVIELLVALLLVLIFTRLAKKIATGDAPRGTFQNLFESMLLYMRDEVARPAIGHHDADRFVPLLWTIFFFILACNLMGMLPWLGALTGAWGVTLALAGVTFATVLGAGMLKFGPIGFWFNQVPSMDLPLLLSPLKLVIFVIEVFGMLIKHTILSVRLLANMVAGHLVLLGILGLIVAAATASTSTFATVAAVSVIASAIFSCLELFVAFLQAYIFTFLSALFIGAAVHHH